MRSGLLLFLMLASAGFSDCWRAAARTSRASGTPLAMLANVRGEVRVHHPIDGWRDVYDGGSVYARELVRTGAGARATLVLANEGGRIHIEPNSLLRIRAEAVEIKEGGGELALSGDAAIAVKLDVTTLRAMARDVAVFVPPLFKELGQDELSDEAGERLRNKRMVIYVKELMRQWMDANSSDLDWLDEVRRQVTTAETLANSGATASVDVATPCREAWNRIATARKARAENTIAKIRIRRDGDESRLENVGDTAISMSDGATKTIVERDFALRMKAGGSVESQALPAAPVLARPAKGEVLLNLGGDRALDFAWSGPPGSLYRVQVAKAKDKDFGQLLSDEERLRIPRLSLPPLPDGNYHWRAYSVDEEGNRSRWSEPVPFEIGEDHEPPGLIVDPIEWK